jgi:uncharacterized membrane protein
MLGLNPFDLKAALLAKHAQHVVLIHFPIALYLSGTVFDFCARIFRKSALAEVARWNFLVAAVMSIPASATGILAWQWALEGKHLKGVLLLHLLFGCATVIGLWLTVWLGSKRRLTRTEAIPVALLLIEAGVCVIVAVTGHLGGFLSGVNTGS